MSYADFFWMMNGGGGEMGKMSREKGKRGEREWAAICRKHGFNCRRTSQYCGNTGEAADVIGIEGIHMEVKRVERLNLRAAVDQVKRDCGDKIGIVFHRTNNTEWLATLDGETMLEILKKAGYE